MKCFRLRCYVNNSFLVFHQGTKHSKTIKHSRFALVFHTVFSCLDPLMKHSNSLFTYNMQTRVFNAMRTLPDLTSYENLSQSKLFKTAITVKLLKSKVTLLNIHARYCEKLKMTHETQLDLGNIKSKVNCKSLVVVKHVTIKLECGSGCGTEQIHGEDAERIWG